MALYWHLLATLAAAIDPSPAAAKPQLPACSTAAVFLSDSSPQFKYLENRQREIYEGNPSWIDPISRAEVVSNWDEHYEQPGALASVPSTDCDQQDPSCSTRTAQLKQTLFDIACGDLPTRYESPMTYFGVRILMNQIRRSQGDRFPETPDLLFGSLPLGNIDAQALRVPNTSVDLIIINRDILYFTSIFSNVIVNAIPITMNGAYGSLSFERKDIRNRLLANPQIVTSYVDAMVLLVTKGIARGTKKTDLDEAHLVINKAVVFGLTSFVMAHEVAHVALKHTGSTRTLFIAGGRVEDEEPEPGGTDIIGLGIQERSRDQEFAADAAGYRLLRESIEGPRDEMSRLIVEATPELFFGIIEQADRLSAEFDYPGISGTTHPSAAERSAALESLHANISETIDLWNSPIPGSSREVPDFRFMLRESLLALAEEAEPLIRTKLTHSKKSE